MSFSSHTRKKNSKQLKKRRNILTSNMIIQPARSYFTTETWRSCHYTRIKIEILNISGTTILSSCYNNTNSALTNRIGYFGPIPVDQMGCYLHGMSQRQISISCYLVERFAATYSRYECTYGGGEVGWEFATRILHYVGR